MSLLKKSESRPDSSRVLALVRRYLRHRVRTVHDVQVYLQRHRVPEPLRTQVLDACVAQGLLDDVIAGRLWAEHWARRGYASHAIHAKLTAKGLNAQTIRQVIQAVGTTETDDMRARVVAARVVVSAPGPPVRLRVARRLASRGFDSDVIERILHELFHSPID